MTDQMPATLGEVISDVHPRPYFVGKVICITGAASGIGRATAAKLALEGAIVSLADTSSNDVHHVRDLLSSDKSTTQEVLAAVVDVRDMDQVQKWLEQTVQKFGRIDGLVNCAGIASENMLEKRVEKLDVDVWRYTLDVNLTGSMHCMKAALPYMKDGAAIVNISSIIAEQGIPLCSDYAASKAGVIALSQVAAKEYAKTTVRVNVIVPGPIDTPLMKPAKPKFEAVLGRSWEELIPMGRMGKVQEVANLIEFLLNSYKASYITGAVINIDGGLGA